MECTVYKLLVGTRTTSALLNPFKVGSAIKEKIKDHYVLRLTMFPRAGYYLVKVKDSLTNYLVFSHCHQDREHSRFRGLVGYGRLTEDLKTHLEIRFPLLGLKVFMKLTAAEQRGDQ